MKNYYTIIIIFFHWSGIFLDFYILIYFNQLNQVYLDVDMRHSDALKVAVSN